MITRMALGVVANLAIGTMSHLIAYPLIENWHSHRMRRLARPAIGVIANVPAFIMWMKIYDGEKDEAAVNGFSAYCISFLWNGVGVVLGYLITDWKQSR